MFQPNGQTLKGEHERRLGLVATWVQQFPRDGRTEKDLDRHIRSEFGVTRFTSCTYRRLARERLGAAHPGMEHLAALLLEWGEQCYEEIEAARATLLEKARRRTQLIGTLAKLCPRNLTWQVPAELPVYSAEEQARYLNGEGPGGVDPFSGGESCGR